jgi:CO/xanthine dehydrogenase FAD-binding subunit
MTQVLVPGTISELDEMAFRGQLIAGGTDVLVQLRAGASVEQLVDVTNLDDAPPVVDDHGDVLEVSALAPLTDVIRCLAGRLPALAQAADVFASWQIRNRATIGGNLANASPAADMVPPLVVAGAVLQLRCSGVERQVSLEEFALGPRRTVLQPGEWIRAISVPKSSGAEGFRKVGARAAMAISISSLAWRWRRRLDGSLSDVRVAVGAVAPTVRRCRETESALEGRRPEAQAAAAADILRGEIAPIDDLRASSWYRREVTSALLVEALLRESTRPASRSQCGSLFDERS